tara:strand:- start:324 stop:1505 length:1182 start_codon:yes stop_codon:yes gene_type:complete
VEQLHKICAVGNSGCNICFGFNGNIPTIKFKMKIGSTLENQKFEKRIAVTPDIVKKYISLGFEIFLSENYGSHLGIQDKEYLDLGVKLKKNESEILQSSDLIIQLGILSDKKISLIKDNQTLIGVLNPYENEEQLKNLKERKVNLFSLELLPRITRAQSMDILSSQANLAGYKAVIESFANFEKAIPMMMTAAGTIPAAKVLVVGAGVAGLQAVATAKRMGAIVFGTDVRMASKEQVESLGGKFLTVEGSENLETEGGYAKEASEEFKKKQEELLADTLKKIDIVVCTALIPGKKAPLIIKDHMISNMQPGSVIYDLAAVQGGNTAFTEADKIIEKNGVKIIGESNILNKLPISASNLYAKNVFNFIENLYDKDQKKININLEDEIISKTLIK